MKKKLLFTTSTIIILSFIAKALSFFVKIYLARTLSNEAMNAYTLMMPTLIFLITLSQLGIPNSIAHLCAKHQNPSYFCFIASLILSITCVILMIGYYVLIPNLATLLFDNPNYQILLKSLLFLIPFVALSALLKAYLQAKQLHLYANIANVLEEIARISYLLWIFYNHQQYNDYIIASIALFSIVIGEIASSLFMLLSLKINKKKYIHFISHFHHLKFNDFILLINNAFWMSCSRFIGAITCFLEPILMFVLVNFNHEEILFEYTSLNSFILPIITISSFLSITLANYLLPSFSFHYSQNNVKYAKKLVLFIISIAMIISMITSCICYFNAEFILNLFYHQTRGMKLLTNLSVPFMIYSLQPLLSSLLHALNLSKQATLDTLYGCIIRLFIIVFFTPMIKEHAIALALVSSMFITTIFHAIRLFYHPLFQNK